MMTCTYAQDERMMADRVCESPVVTSSPSPSILRPGLQHMLQSRSAPLRSCY